MAKLIQVKSSFELHEEILSKPECDFKFFVYTGLFGSQKSHVGSVQISILFIVVIYSIELIDRMRSPWKKDSR